MSTSGYPIRFLLGFFCLIVFSCQSDSPPEQAVKGEKSPKVVSSPNAKEPTSFMRKFFQVKSAKIEFVYSGVFEGKETFYFDDWGNTVVMIEDKKEFGNARSQTIIWKDKQTTIFNHDERTIWRGKSRVRGTEPPAVAGLEQSQLEMVGYKKLPDKQIAGKMCTVYENSKLKVKYWLWQGIDLKIDNHSLGDAGYVREAQSVEEGIQIPESLLVAPAGYTATP